VSAEYVLGDNDTKIEARKLALEQAKKIALEQAGTYMEIKTVVKNGKLTTDEIKSFGASVLKTHILNEKYFFEGRTPILEVTIESEIDITILKESIDFAKRNK
jgi:polyhydroxyalkanoate synthesis regulator phasin